MSDNNQNISAVKIGRSRSIKGKKKYQAGDASSSTTTNNNPETIPESNEPTKDVSDIIAISSKDKEEQAYVESLIGNVNDLNINKGQKVKVDLLKLTIVCSDENIRHEYPESELSTTPIKIKEDMEFDIILDVRVSNDLLLGLRYNHVLKKMGLVVDTVSEIIGSYAPKKEVQQLNIKHLHAPKGMLGRGKYNVSSALTDDDDGVHKEWSWILKVGKKWDGDDE